MKEQFKTCVKEALKRSGDSPIIAANKLNLKRDAIRGVMRGASPSIDRAAEIAEALGLEFYIGPPRGDDRGKREIPALQSAGNSIDTHTQGLVRAVHEAGGDPIPPELRVTLAGAAADEPPGARPVDVVELACAAGGGAEVLSEDVIGRLWFRRDWLDEHGLDATQCAVLGVHGDSMQPTLAAGAKILINRANRQRRTNRIYVIHTDDGVIVKRLRKAGPKDWRLVSDNKDKTAWPNITLSPEAEIIGQVVWTARTL